MFLPTLFQISIENKAAVHHLTKHLASKLASRKINVNAIAPGAFETKMMAGTLDSKQKKKKRKSFPNQQKKIVEFRDTIEASIPLQRLGKITDISGVCIYLCSRAGEWVTGAILTVDGGALVSFRPMALNYSSLNIKSKFCKKKIVL